MMYKCNLCKEIPWGTTNGVASHLCNAHKIGYDTAAAMFDALVTEMPEPPTCREACEKLIELHEMYPGTVSISTHIDVLPNGETIVEFTKAALDAARATRR